MTEIFFCRNTIHAQSILCCKTQSSKNHWMSICPSLSVLLACFYVHLRIFGWYGNVNITSDVLKRQANFSHVWCYKRTSMFAFFSNKQFQLCRLYERAIGIAFSLGTVTRLTSLLFSGDKLIVILRLGICVGNEDLILSIDQCVEMTFLRASCVDFLW